MNDELLVEDTIAYPTMLRLIDCLVTKMREANMPELCFAGLMPGGTAPWDFCDCGEGKCGQAWVRLVNVYPSLQFPNQETLASCGTNLAYRLEIGIVRCIPVPDSRGTMPGMPEELEAVRKQMADMAVMRRAINCCMRDVDKRYVLESYTPTENSGGCGGGTWTVIIEA